MSLRKINLHYDESQKNNFFEKHGQTAIQNKQNAPNR